MRLNSHKTKNKKQEKKLKSYVRTTEASAHSPEIASQQILNDTQKKMEANLQTAKMELKYKATDQKPYTIIMEGQDGIEKAHSLVIAKMIKQDLKIEAYKLS